METSLILDSSTVEEIFFSELQHGLVWGSINWLGQIHCNGLCRPGSFGSSRIKYPIRVSQYLLSSLCVVRVDGGVRILLPILRLFQDSTMPQPLKAAFGHP